MAHFAELDETNIVKQVIVVHNNELLDENNVEQEQKGIDFCVAHYGGNWVQTSFNGSIRKRYASVGMIYDPIFDAFYAPQEYPSWIFNETICQWEAPVPRPTDKKLCTWNEELQEWEEVLFNP
jgi:hypothetical protein